MMCGDHKTARGTARGSINVKSEPGKGTVVRILLPVLL